jgi:hypothetical protein
MVGTGDTRIYTSSGLRRVTPYVQFEVLMFLCRVFVVVGTNWSGEGSRPKSLV